jgi:hypothetical protein
MPERWTLSGSPLMIRLTILLIAAVVTIMAERSHAQGAFPAPLPGEQSAPANVSPVPQVDGMVRPALPVAPGAPPPRSALADACHKGFAALRDEAERRGRLVKAASERRAPREEACQFIGSFSEAELAMVSYVEANAVKCGLQSVAARLRAGAIKTEEMYRRICAVPGV